MKRTTPYTRTKNMSYQLLINDEFVPGRFGANEMINPC